jgi:para-aminobenzoate synthetase component 1
MTRCITAPYHNNPEYYFAQLRHLPDFIWLDSGRPYSQQGRYDIFTALATANATIDNQGQFSHTADKTIASLDDWVAHFTQNEPKNTTECELPFSGGVIGHFCYH